jgi:hypothetical protein
MATPHRTLPGFHRPIAQLRQPMSRPKMFVEECHLCPVVVLLLKTDNPCAHRTSTTSTVNGMKVHSPLSVVPPGTDVAPFW